MAQNSFEQALFTLLQNTNASQTRLAEAITALQAPAAAAGRSPAGHLPKYEENEDFENFVQKFEAITDVYNMSPQRKIAEFVSALPNSTFQLLKNLLHPLKFNSEEVNFQKIVEVLEAHLKPKPLVIPSRHELLHRKQQEGESLSQFMAALRQLVIPCKYGEAIMKEMLRDVFVAGIRSRAILDRIFEEDDADLDKIFKIALAVEKAEESTQQILHSKHKSSVDAVKPAPKQKFDKSKQSSKPATAHSTDTKCYACGSNQHDWSACPVKSTLKCKYCQLSGHIESICQKKAKEQQQKKPNFRKGGKKKPAHDTFNVHNVKKLRDYKPWFLNMCVQGVPIQMEVDSGTGASFCPLSIYKKFKVPMQSTSAEFNPYGEGSARLKPLGLATVEVTYRGRRASLPLYVLSGECTPLIGRQWLEELEILNQADLHMVEPISGNDKQTRWDLDLSEKFPELFSDGIGLAKNFVASITLKSDAKPVFRKARPIPFALRARVEDELNRMVNDGVLEHVDYSEYATPIVPVIQGDAIRVCADYSCTVNPQLEIPQHPLPRLEELLFSIRNCKIFAKLDIRKAYLSLPVDELTAKTLTLNTHMGLFKPKRLMFGCASAPVIWTRYMEDVVQGIPGLAVFFDDILLGAESKEALQKKLLITLQRLNDNGLRLNYSKCEFFVKSVKYLGHQISAAGITKTKERVEAILMAERPDSTESLQHFLGMITFYGRYFPDMASEAAPLYEATKKTFQWNKKLETIFQRLKQVLASDKVLAHYDPDLPVILCCDASPSALGAVLQHVYPDGSERPILYVHKKLDQHQVNYSQLDKEALAIKWAVERLHHYLIGREWTLYTDHRPLVHIFGKQRSKLPPLCATRLLHYALFLQNFQFTIKYRCSAEHGNADYMSRLPTHSRELGVPDTVELFEVKHMSALPKSPKEIAAETLRDPELRELLDKLRRGESISGHDGAYSIQSGCILRGLRVYIPHAFRPAILEELHAGHMGIVKVKALARGFVYWKNIDHDIEQMCRNCPECALHKGRPVKTDVHHWEYPANAWERLHIDFAFYGGKTYLIIVDAHSKWPEIFIVPDMNSSTVINVFESLFARYGLPLTVISDNQTSLVSRDMQKFYKEHGIRHMTSPPYHAASNGQAERFVSSLKVCLRTLNHSPGTPQQKLNKFLAAYRRAPHATTNMSPAFLFLKREPRTLINLAKPNVVNDHHDKVRGNKNFLRTAVFSEGQTVAVRSFTNPLKKWVLGTIVARDGDRQWTVLVEGELARRHSDHLRPVGDELRAPGQLLSRPAMIPDPGPATEQSESPPVASAAASSQQPMTPSPPTSVTAASSPQRRTSMQPQSQTPSVRVSLAPQQETPVVAERRSRRQRKQPDRLGYDH